MTAAAENPVSHEYVVIKGSETLTALSDKLCRFSQAAKIEEVYPHQTRLSSNRHRVMSYEMLLFTNR
jgi:hypothetical protein